MTETPSDAKKHDDVEEELEKAREHADPTRGNKTFDGGDRVSEKKGRQSPRVRNLTVPIDGMGCRRTDWLP